MATKIVEKVNISTSNDSYAIASTAYFICTTPANTPEKTVNDIGGFVLFEGVTIHVKFENGNSAAQPTLDVSNTGATPISYYGNTRTDLSAMNIPVGGVVSFTYIKHNNAFFWVMNSGYNVDTHYNANIYTTGNSGTSAITTDTNDPYIALVENSTRRSAIQIKAGTNISVKGNDGIITINNTYTHPTGDGNLHVPATGTTNNGKFLKAGSTAGSLEWATAVTSVQVQASSPLQSSSNTAQISTLNTTISFINQNKNLVLAGPSTGDSAAAPSFRALVVADLPTVTVGKGGTNITSYTIGDILYASAATTLSKLAGNTTKTRKFLRSVATTEGTATAPVWDTVTKTDVGLSNVENTKLSTWTGSSSITTVGTITSGTWQGTAIAAAYIGSHTHSYAGSSSAGGAATSANALNFVHTNEILIGNTNAQASIHINHRRVFNGATSGNTAITDYYFKNGNGKVDGVTIHAANFDGLAAKATGDADGNAIKTTYAKLASPTFTGIPKSVTPSADSDDKMIATKEYVDGYLAVADAMVFKGTLGTGGTITTLPATHNAGDTYRVITAGDWAGKTCNVGDLVICIKDGTEASDADWTSVETNEDGAISGPTGTSATKDNAIVRWDGTVGRMVQNSKDTIDDNGHITLDDDATILRKGKSCTWNTSNTNAMLRMTTKNAWAPMLVLKATSGWWTMGHYDTSGYSNHLLFGFLADVDVSGVTNAKNHLDYTVRLLPTIYGTNTGTTTNRAFVTTPWANNTAAVGNSTQPVYIDEDGVATACTTYANASVNYAASAGKATNDGNGDAITTTYIKNGLLTTKGDIIYASKANTPARLAIGTAGYFLKATANGPVWSNTTDIAISLTNTTASTSTTTGALTVDGGVGVDGRITAAEVNATRTMVVKSGKIYSNISSSDVLLPAKTTMMFANGIAIANPGLAGANDVGWIRVTGTAETDTVLEIATGDDGGSGEQIVARQYNTSNAVVHEAVLLSKTGATTFPVSVTAPSFVGALTGNVTGNVSGTSANVTGTVAIAHGGTGLTKANPHEVLIGPQTETAAAPTWRMIDNNDIAPIASQRYSEYTCSENNQNKAVLFFGKINITNTTTWQAPWAIHYRVYVSTTEANTQGWYDCYFSVQGSTVCYYNYNNFHSTDYRPIYHHRLLYPKNTYSSYGAFFGVRVQDSRSVTSLARTFTVEILETKNCTVELYGTIRRFDEVYVTTNSIAAGTIWNNSDYNATSAGLQESGDTNSNDTGYYILSNGFRMVAGDSPNKVYRYTLFGRIANGKYESFVTSSTTDTTKTKNTHGFLPDGKIYWNNNNADYTGATSVSIHEQQHSIDYRYTFNISTTGIPANAQTYIVFTYDRDDGLLYLADNWFTTTPNTTGFIYQRIGNNYYGSADYRGSLLLENPYYIFDGTDLQVWHPYAEVSKFTASVALYEPRATTTTLNKSANYVAAGAMFHLIASSSTSATDNGKTPTNANILQMNWDTNEGYDAQLGISDSGCRMYFRSRASTKEAWQEVAHAQAGNAVGNATTPIYMSETGVLTAGTALGTSSVQNEEYFVKAITSTDTAIVRYNGKKGQVQDSTATIDSSGNLSIKGQLNLNRYSNSAYGRINFYRTTDSSYTSRTWYEYMSNTANGTAPNGGKPGSLGNVTEWARRSLIENGSGYGWVWEASTNSAPSGNTVSPTVRMALSSNTGQLRIAPNASSTSCQSGGLIIDSAKNGSSGNVAIELWRGSSGNNNASWQIANDGGTLYFRNNYTTSVQSTYSQNSLSIACNTGNATFSGSVTASSFSGTLTGNVTGNVTGNAGSAGTIAAKLAATTKTYLLGTSTTITSTAANVELSGDTYVYLDVTAGSFSASRHYLNITGTEKAYIEYNSSDNAIDFVFL